MKVFRLELTIYKLASVKGTKPKRSTVCELANKKAEMFAGWNTQRSELRTVKGNKRKMLGTKLKSVPCKVRTYECKGQNVCQPKRLKVETENYTGWKLKLKNVRRTDEMSCAIYSG
ncbi:hypothetical protein Csa_018499 [Cucumis sativus]|uniref:Uncharacterized protein n=1 Tax=Cucumis sativus TaxID=3659 RepID=A0A0A0KPK1_CUCSA|nr:hypothetical protein Csa_018499 [Cucumis sativus]